jgi:hypothetical protein
VEVVYGSTVPSAHIEDADVTWGRRPGPGTSVQMESATPLGSGMHVTEPGAGLGGGDGITFGPDPNLELRKINPTTGTPTSTISVTKIMTKDLKVFTNDQRGAVSGSLSGFVGYLGHRTPLAPKSEANSGHMAAVSSRKQPASVDNQNVPVTCGNSFAGALHPCPLTP